MSIYQSTFFISHLSNFLRNFTVFTYLYISIDIDMNPNLLLRISLHYVVRNDIELILNQISQTKRVTNFEKNVINRTKINIFHAISFHMLKNSTIFHLTINGTVSTRCQWHLTLRLNDYLSIIADSWNTSLREENYWLRMVSKVIVLFEICAYLFMVHFTSHDIPFYHVGLRQNRMGKFFLDQSHEADQSMCKESE